MNIPDDPSTMDLPFHGKRRLVQRGPWVPCSFWMEGGIEEDATYHAWVNGQHWIVPDPLQTPLWPWYPCEPGEWERLYEEWKHAHQ